MPRTNLMGGHPARLVLVLCAAVLMVAAASAMSPEDVIREELRRGLDPDGSLERQREENRRIVRENFEKTRSEFINGPRDVEVHDDDDVGLPVGVPLFVPARPVGGYVIRHWWSLERPRGFVGNGAEYIKPDGPVVITSHGMGSGVYGLTEFSESRSKAASGDNCYRDFTLLNPFIVTPNTCNRYSELSMELMRLTQACLEGSDCKRDLFAWANHFANLIDHRRSGDELPKFILRGIREFLNDFKKRTDMVMMPINYVLMDLGYDGVYPAPFVDRLDRSIVRTNPCDAFNKGAVKFLKYPTGQDGDVQLVGECLVRTGIKVHPVRLPYSYQKNENDVFVCDHEAEKEDLAAAKKRFTTLSASAWVPPHMRRARAEASESSCPGKGKDREA